MFQGLADGIGQTKGTLTLKDAGGKTLRSEPLQAESEGAALGTAAGWLTEFAGTQPSAVGHRVVHGGPHLLTHQRITPALIQELNGCVHFAPLHIPVALELIHEAQQTYPEVPQFACFDTAFHTTIPEEGSRFALPRELFDEGVWRYGFHGLSYESIVHSLGDQLRPRTVVAHLGSGASLAALQDGKSQDTTMGFTPTGGIPMATRSGDLDPGVLLYLLREKKMDADALEAMLNQASGLKALSGGIADMRELEKAAAGGDAKAQLAIEIFCRAIRKVIAAYAAVLGGIDMLVFSGGIGEHSQLVRRKVCEGLGFLGVPAGSEGGASAAAARVSVCVVESQEDEQIARHCRAMMRAGQQ